MTDQMFFPGLALLLTATFFVAGCTLAWRTVQTTKQKMKKIKIDRKEDRRGLPRR